MEPLPHSARSLLDDARADAPAPETADRLWQTLRERLDAPLTPTAAAASRALTGKAGAVLWTGTTVKLLVCAATIAGVTGAVAYRGTPAPQRGAATEARAPEAAPVHPAVAREPAPVTQAPAPVAPAPPVTAATSQLAQEARLLADAQRALGRGQPARALARVNEHAARYPRGQLSQTRDAARVLALCALGRTREARDRQQRFQRDWPDSPLADRVQRACEADAR